jgi:hypothetical protein
MPEMETMKRTRFAPALLPVLFLILAVRAAADEGMWLFERAPKELILKKYGFAVTPEWLEHIRLSSVRFGGASASFVSPDGLVLTNHHVGQGLIQNLSTAGRDLMKTGFCARTRAEELPCPGIELRVLREIEDVTDRVLGAETPDMTPARAAEARDKAAAAIEREASGSTGLKCQVVVLYSGSMYHLYKYEAYDDVRLVFAPEYLFAFFGGDTDNFTYPRFDLDVSMFRVYKNGEPLKTPHYLKWASQEVREGDLVFCSGNPGFTGRLLTLAQLEFLRDTAYPFSIANLKRRQALVREYGKKGPEESRVALRSLFGIENSLKATLGFQSGLLDPKLMETKAAAERLLRDAVAHDPALTREFGGAWDAVADAQDAYGSFFKSYTFFERANGFFTPTFNMARNLVRMAMEKARPDDARLREYRDANLSSIERSILSPAPINDAFEIVKLADSLTQLREELGDAPEVRWILGGRDPGEVARELVSGTKLADPAVRRALMDGGLDAIYASEDPMIKLALLVDPVSRGLRTRYEKEVEAVETRNGARIARAMFRLKGTAIAPDATSTLRLSYGVVRGYADDGAKVPFRTTYAGLYERSRREGNATPYELPPAVLAKRRAVSPGTPLNYVATCDSIGGNSGSPVVNREGEFTGVLFDGNIQSLPWRFVYEDTVSRSVMVHASGIIEALVNIYGAKPLADEILGRK